MQAHPSLQIECSSSHIRYGQKTISIHDVDRLVTDFSKMPHHQVVHVSVTQAETTQGTWAQFLKGRGYWGIGRRGMPMLVEMPWPIEKTLTTLLQKLRQPMRVSGQNVYMLRALTDPRHLLLRGWVHSLWHKLMPAWLSLIALGSLSIAIAILMPADVAVQTTGVLPQRTQCVRQMIVLAPVMAPDYKLQHVAWRLHQDRPQITMKFALNPSQNQDYARIQEILQQLQQKFGGRAKMGAHDAAAGAVMIEVTDAH